MIGVILAGGGTGTRLNRGVPKAVVKLRGKPLFMHTLSLFHGMREVSEIVLILPEVVAARYGERLRKTFPRLPASWREESGDRIR